MEYLGNLEKVYKTNLQYKIVGVIFGVASLGTSAVFPAGLLLDDSFVLKNSSFLFMPFFAGLSLFMGFFGILLIYGFFRMRNDNLCFYENGLVLTQKGQVHTAKWDEIEGLGEGAVQFIVNGLPSRTNYSFTVTKFDGEKFVIGATLKDIEAIGKRLADEIFKRRVPAVVGKYNRGETVKFGKFSINQSYLFSEKCGRLPLSDVETISAFEGTIIIRKKNKLLNWDSAKYDSIPNARILLTIWETIK